MLEVDVEDDLLCRAAGLLISLSRGRNSRFSARSILILEVDSCVDWNFSLKSFLLSGDDEDRRKGNRAWAIWRERTEDMLIVELRLGVGMWD